MGVVYTEPGCENTNLWFVTGMLGLDGHGHIAVFLGQINAIYHIVESCHITGISIVYSQCYYRALF